MHPRIARISRLATYAMIVGLGMNIAGAQTASKDPVQRVMVWSRAGVAVDGDVLQPARMPGAARVHRVGGSSMHLVEVNGPGPAQELMNRLGSHSLIRQIEIDRWVAPSAVVLNDPYQGSLWHLARLNLDGAWASTGGKGVTIAVVDSGVMANHPDLQGNVVAGWNLSDNTADTNDVSGHGTAVAGVAAALANNGLGVAGVAYQANIMPFKVTRADGQARISDIARAIVMAADRGAKVVNASFEGLYNSFMIESAANYLRSKGGLLFVAAGNSGASVSTSTGTGTGTGTKTIPVAAVNSRNESPTWSTSGSHVALVAPGVGVWTTALKGGYKSVSGSSYASPMVAAVAALLWAERPNARPQEIEAWLKDSAVDLGAPGRDATFGHGMVDATKAMALAVSAAPIQELGSDVLPSRGAAAASMAKSVSVAGVVVDSSIQIVDQGWTSGVESVEGHPSVGLIRVNVSPSMPIGRVELLVDGKRVSVETDAPFEFALPWHGLPSGNFRLEARAYSVDGSVLTQAEMQYARPPLRRPGATRLR